MVKKKRGGGAGFICFVSSPSTHLPPAPLQTITVSRMGCSLLFQSTPFVMWKPTQQGACTSVCMSTPLTCPPP